MAQKAIIIGAGPAGLTAALEFLRKTDIQPIVLEATEEIGGISRTIRYKGNRMDIGGHRFFSKSDRVMQWWMELMPAATDERCSGDDRNQVPGQAAQGGGAGRSPRSLRCAGWGRCRTTETEETDAVDEEVEEEHGQTTTVVTPDPEDSDHVMLVRPRKSRIYYLRKFFDYPIKLTWQHDQESRAGTDGADRHQLCGVAGAADQGREEP